MRRLTLALACLVAALLCGAPAAAWAAVVDAEPDHRDTPAELAAVSVGQEVQEARLITALTPMTTPAALPTTWCGTATSGDDTANAALPSTLPQFKVFYAYPSDRPNRFAQWRDNLQANVSLIEQYVSSQPGSSRAPRFDLGTSCGPEYLDIQTVALPGPRATYLDNMSAIDSAVRAAYGAAPGLRNYVVLADTLGSSTYGLGALYAGSTQATRPDAGNIHNNGSLTAVVFFPDATAPAASASGWWPTGMLHEMSHTMGAVQWSAPHSSQPAGGTNGIYGHCWDGYDLMCYQDGPAMSHPYTTTSCPQAVGTIDETYDCGQDDYFNPSPAGGSYLATHWDIYNNVFLADCATLPAGTCLVTPSSGPPVAAVAPAITGTVRRGQVLTAGAGTWSPAATSLAYQWQRDGGSGFADISGATGPSYSLAAADVGATVRVHVVATNGSGTGTVDANPVGPVADAIPVNTLAPAVTGTARASQTVTATTGTWSPAGTSYAYQWQRDSGSGFADVAGATTAARTLAAGDTGAQVRVRVTATNAYGSVTAASAAVGPVASAAPANSVAPSIVGTPRRGQGLVALPGTWSPAGTSYTYQWQRDTGSGVTDVAGATLSAYTPVAADVAATLRVRVTATNTYGTTTAASATSAAVLAAPPVGTAAPTITGTATRTMTLVATAGGWTPTGATFAYQWQRDSGSGFAAIAGATAASYVLATADVGAVVRVQVIATNPDGTATAVSAATTTVAAATPAATALPVISGAMQVGEDATASTGAWSPPATSYAYQWQRVTGAGAADISGATAATYTLASADLGARVRVRVTATNADGATQAFSVVGAVVTQPPSVVTAPAAPTGTLTDASTLTASPGVWSPSTATLTYQWYGCPAGASALTSACSVVGHGPTYVLAGSDVGRTVAVRVTASTSGGATAANGTPTATITGRALTSVAAPTIGPTVQVAEIVRALPGTWSVPTLTLRYQWLRCAADGTSCQDIAGAVTAQYAISTADSGHQLAVRETATSPGRTALATSTPVTVADQPLPVSGAAPAVSGTTQRLQVLRAGTGTWSGRPTAFAFQWQRCAADGTGCADIAGATATSYALAAADVGATVAVVVHATNTAGTVAATSAPTAVVAGAPPVLRVAPQVTGRAQVPTTLQAVRATWQAPSDTRYAYQWRRCNAAGASCTTVSGATSPVYKLGSADVGATLRVAQVATNPDGTVTAVSPPSGVVVPPAPGMVRYPTMAIDARPVQVGRVLTFRPATWTADATATSVTFWRCTPRCVAIANGGALTYTLGSADVAAIIRASETATGPGGTTTRYAQQTVGPVIAAAAASATLPAGRTATLRTSSGAALAVATVSRPAAVVAGAVRTTTLRVKLRRRAPARRGPLRAWACVTPAAVIDATPCTRAVALRATATLTVAVAPGQRLQIVVAPPRRS